MGVPRRYARIGQWYLEAGSWVNKGDRLISFRGVSCARFEYCTRKMAFKIVESSRQFLVLIILVVAVAVYEPSLVHPKTNPNGRFPPTYPSPQFKDNPGKQQEEKEHIEAVLLPSHIFLASKSSIIRLQRELHFKLNFC
jgi:hypothetical protein